MKKKNTSTKKDAVRSGRYFVGLKKILLSKKCKGLAYKDTRRGREEEKCEKNKKLSSTPRMLGKFKYEN